MPVVGCSRRRCDDPEAIARVSGFRQGLSEAGFVEGRNVRSSTAWRGERSRPLARTAADWCAQAAVIADDRSTGAGAARGGDATIPIVFTNRRRSGRGRALSQSLIRPGGNITGLHTASSMSRTKWLELLKESVHGWRVLVLLNPDNYRHAVSYEQSRLPHRQLVCKWWPRRISAGSEIAPAFSAFARQPTAD